MYKNKKTAAVIVAAGSGRRMGGQINKQYIKLGDVPVLARSFRIFAKNPYIDTIVIAVKKDEEDRCLREAVASCDFPGQVKVIAGGAERYDSVIACLDALPDDTDYVLIHDGARPLASRALTDRVLEACSIHGAAIPGIPVKDTIKCLRSDTADPVIAQTPDRSLLRAVQTPQGFDLALLRQAYAALTDPSGLTDDASAVEAAGIPVYIVEGEEMNIKITTPSDVTQAENLLSADRTPAPFPAGLPRTGTGFDVHAFAENRKLILGGVDIPYEKGLLGHSDADVLVHAIMDALLGAAAMGDIGKHFPDTDQQYKDADSLVLLSRVGSLLSEAGYSTINIDATVIAQRPRISPFIPAMKKNIAEVLKISESQINIKGTTTERLGFTGRGEGIAAQAAASIVLLR